MASMFLCYISVPEAGTSCCRNLVCFRRMVRLWLSLHVILRAIRIPAGDKLDKAWDHWVGKRLRNGDIIVTSTCPHKEKYLSGIEGPLAPKYPH